MTPVSYFLSDAEGVLCVAVRATDWTEPRYVVNHYPTPLRTWDFCRNYEVKADQLRHWFTVRERMPGEYHAARDIRFATSCFLPLVGGAKCLPVATTFEEVPRPRLGKGSTLEWESGRWTKTLPSGKRVAVYV
jgi:hypothetical protein